MRTGGYPPCRSCPRTQSSPAPLLPQWIRRTGMAGTLWPSSQSLGRYCRPGRGQCRSVCAGIPAHSAAGSFMAERASCQRPGCRSAPDPSDGLHPARRPSSPLDCPSPSESKSPDRPSGFRGSTATAGTPSAPRSCLLARTRRWTARDCRRGRTLAPRPGHSRSPYKGAETGLHRRRGPLSRSIEIPPPSLGQPSPRR
jgi:hypothetical protein